LVERGQSRGGAVLRGKRSGRRPPCCEAAFKSAAVFSDMLIAE